MKVHLAMRNRVGGGATPYCGAGGGKRSGSAVTSFVVGDGDEQDALRDADVCERCQGMFVWHRWGVRSRSEERKAAYGEARRAGGVAALRRESRDARDARAAAAFRLHGPWRISVEELLLFAALVRLWWRGNTGPVHRHILLLQYEDAVDRGAAIDLPDGGWDTGWKRPPLPDAAPTPDPVLACVDRQLQRDMGVSPHDGCRRVLRHMMLDEIDSNDDSPMIALARRRRENAQEE